MVFGLAGFLSAILRASTTGEPLKSIPHPAQPGIYACKWRWFPNLGERGWMVHYWDGIDWYMGADPTWYPQVEGMDTCAISGYESDHKVRAEMGVPRLKEWMPFEEWKVKRP